MVLGFVQEAFPYPVLGLDQSFSPLLGPILLRRGPGQTHLESLVSSGSRRQKLAGRRSRDVWLLLPLYLQPSHRRQHLSGEFFPPHPSIVAVPESPVNAGNRALWTHSDLGPQTGTLKPTKGQRSLNVPMTSWVGGHKMTLQRVLTFETGWNGDGRD